MVENVNSASNIKNNRFIYPGFFGLKTQPDKCKLWIFGFLNVYKKYSQTVKAIESQSFVYFLKQDVILRGYFYLQVMIIEPVFEQFQCQLSPVAFFFNIGIERAKH